MEEQDASASCEVLQSGSKSGRRLINLRGEEKTESGAPPELDCFGCPPFDSVPVHCLLELMTGIPLPPPPSPNSLHLISSYDQRQEDKHHQSRSDVSAQVPSFTEPDTVLTDDQEGDDENDADESDRASDDQEDEDHEDEDTEDEEEDETDTDDTVNFECEVSSQGLEPCLIPHDTLSSCDVH